MSFSEETFIYSLLHRPEDCKLFTSFFNPGWLRTPEYKPILEEVFNFNKKYGMPPSLSALRRSIEEKDPAIYQSRYSKAIDKIENITPKPELPDMIMTVDKAKEIAISWSLKELVATPGFIELSKQGRGHEQMTLITAWMRQFQTSADEVEMDFKDAVKYLITQKGFQNKDMNISCGIKVIDRMLRGGLRPKNLGIILAPTGGGKSFCLTVMARKMTTIEDKNVFFISNELSMEETTERFISSLTSTKMEDLTSTIEDADQLSDTEVQSAQLDKHWQYGLHNRLRLWEVKREISTDEIEAMLAKLRGLYGWKPDVIILDYMERMKPTVSGVRRDQSWNWYGAIAKDLCRLAKVHNVLVWTAAQLNRSGQKTENVIDLTAASGSIQHTFEAAVVISVRMAETPEGGQIMGFKSHKTRHTKKNSREEWYEVDAGHMIITDEPRKQLEFLLAKKKKGEEDEA